MSTVLPRAADLLIIGAGPAGLAAAQAAAEAGTGRVVVWEAGPRPGRKFLLAGRSGLNLTRASDAAAIAAACGPSAPRLAACVAAYPPAAIAAWSASLGHPTFVGTSGKVFPQAMQANGLLAAWLAHLQDLGVELHCQQRLIRLQPSSLGKGWIATSAQHQQVCASQVILALGGGSWPSTGSDGGWCSWLSAMGVQIEPLSPANCGVEIAWDAHLRHHHQGAAVKNLCLHLADDDASPVPPSHIGEAVITAYGLEGYAIYPAIPQLRQILQRGDTPQLLLDLARGRSVEDLGQRLQRHARASFANRLRKAARLSAPAVALLRQFSTPEARQDPKRLAAVIKALPVPIQGLRPLAEAISTAGGVAWSQLNEHFMLHAHPGLYCIGEMVDWEAPTGGYLLSVSLAMGHHAGRATTLK
ncbi:MAG: TIGR03862 family flavoprotein [Planctomycetota bacterium]|nr:MAG: TIGR03862 family flavoprotein [Planctomycetota bacterium]